MHKTLNLHVFSPDGIVIHEIEVNQEMKTSFGVQWVVENGCDRTPYVKAVPQWFPVEH